MVELIGGGSVINGATPSSFYNKSLYFEVSVLTTLVVGVRDR